jgi:hypothetical protein
MNVTLEQSVHIYARASRGWFGTKAYQKTQERIEQLAKIGDAEGAKVHELVKQHIAQLDTGSCRSGEPSLSCADEARRAR